MAETLKLGSLFDGQGSWMLAAQLSGINPQFASEVEPAPIMVTKKRFPNVPHLGDVSAIKGNEAPIVDIISFSSPCQDISVAGKRQGMKHSLNGDESATRSGLFFDAIRICEEMRKVSGKPRYGCYENVVGVFSSAKGNDFHRLLEEFCWVKDIDAQVPKLDKWPLNGEILGEDYSIAWRVFDAQYYGVPQRRRRVYVTADWDGHTAGKIMFRNEGIDFMQRQRAWTAFAESVPQMTAEECVDLFNKQPIPTDYDFGINEPSGKFASLDMHRGEWTFDVPEEYFIGEKPYWKNPKKLSEILIPNADEKYYLSPKAAAGILRRASERGKELPEVLRIALENQANLQ